MCGIAGIRRFDGRPVDAQLLSTMTDLVGHRGPDDAGLWVQGAIGLGHRRLSIIDVAGSHQPMATPDGRFHLVFNGEIFNYRDLRTRLNYPFSTNGDTETLLAAFAAHGADAVSQLRGQFAFAVYDTTDESLWLFRDRVGILPLYYCTDGAQFAFASEVKAMVPALPRLAMDEESVAWYLTHRSVSAPRTLFRGVKKVGPGQWLHVDRHGSVELGRYWSPPPCIKGINPTQAVDRVDAALRDAVDHALVADVGVGALLSGGVDSALIVALMARGRGGGEDIDTFSAGFGDDRFDELPFARRVSETFRTRHHEVIVRPQDFVDLWPRLTWHRDAPISEPADMAVFRLAEQASQSVKVILTGEGSDEIFGGYPKYRAEPWVHLAHSTLPWFLRRWIAAAGERVLPGDADRPRAVLRALRASDGPARRRAWFASFDPDELAALVLPGGAAPTQHQDDVDDDGTDAVDRMLRLDIDHWLADNLLERGDRMAMAAGVEMRPPYLDHPLMELAFSLPSKVKVRRGRPKWVLKEVARRYLDPAIVDRPKVGFRVPLDEWFRGGLRAEAQSRLLDADSLARRLFHQSEIERLLTSHLTGHRNEHMRIWTLLCLEVWHETFFTSGFTARPPR